MLDEQLEIAKEEVYTNCIIHTGENALKYIICLCCSITVVLLLSAELKRLCLIFQIAQLRHELSMRDDLLQFYASTEEIENAESHSP